MYDDCGWLVDFSCVPLYAVNVTGGTAAWGNETPTAVLLAAAGETVTLTARTATGNERFRRWDTTPTVNLDDPEAATTSFIMPAAPVAAAALFEADVDIAINPGWNLVGLPVTLEAADAIPLADLPAFFCQLVDGQPHYAKATVFPGGQAYWLFHGGADILTLQLTGLPVTTELPAAPGWHLVAPVAATPLPEHAEAWQWNGRAYEAGAGAGATLLPPGAYWLHIHP
jgi:hypothetical protein